MSDAADGRGRRSSFTDFIMQRLPPPPRSMALRWAATALVVALGMSVFLLLREATGVLGWFLLLPSVYLAAMLFGPGAGTIAATLTSAALYVVIVPIGKWLLPAPVVIPFLLFVLIALAIALLTEGLRAAIDRVAGAEHENGVLLAELRHRTRNDLAMVISMLSMQARLKTNAEARGALEKAIHRIEAIASVHEHVELRDQHGRVEMASYLQRLCGHLGDLLRDVRPIAIRVDAQEVYLPAAQAAPIGLIVNELVTNALKHAFPEGRAGVIDVKLRRHDTLTLSVIDNGIGCPTIQREGLGSRLTRLLAEQLGAGISWKPSDVGCEVRVVFRD